jgi:hypothetical protein
MSRIAGLHDADPSALARFHAHGTLGSRHSIGAFRSVVRGQRIERPIGIGEHMNGAILADKDGHFRTCLPLRRRGFGCVQDGLRLFGKTHRFLIAEKLRDSCPIAGF